MKHRTIRFRLRPTSKAKNTLLHKHCGATRAVCNEILARLKKEYEEDGKIDARKFTSFKRFTALKQEEGWKWLQE